MSLSLYPLFPRYFLLQYRSSLGFSMIRNIITTKTSLVPLRGLIRLTTAASFCRVHYSHTIGRVVCPLYQKITAKRMYNFKNSQESVSTKSRVVITGDSFAGVTKAQYRCQAKFSWCMVCLNYVTAVKHTNPSRYAKGDRRY